MKYYSYKRATYIVNKQAVALTTGLYSFVIPLCLGEEEGGQYNGFQRKLVKFTPRVDKIGRHIQLSAMGHHGSIGYGCFKRSLAVFLIPPLTSRMDNVVMENVSF